MKNNIVAEAKAEVAKKQKKEKQMKTTERTQQLKAAAAKTYAVTLNFVCEAIEAAFAYIGVTSLIHTDKTIQTGIAVTLVLLLLIVKFSKK
jgi:hypothetical protein